MKGTEKPSLSFLNCMVKLFVNRADTYAIQREDGSYVRVEKPLNRDVLKRHFAGRVTVGSYQLNPRNNAVKELIFDFDPEKLDDPRSAAQVVLRECVERPSRGEPRFCRHTVLLEASRWPDPSYHVRVLFNPSIPAKVAKWLGNKVLEHAGLSPKLVEVFPKQVGLSPDRPFGNFVKLPLGLHRTANKWSRFLDENFQPLPLSVLLECGGCCFSESDLQRIMALANKEMRVQSKLCITPAREFKRLKGEEEREIVELLARYWRPGYRNQLEMSFLGWCLKRDVSEESAYRIVDAVTKLTGDEEKNGRLESVRYHYRNRRSLGVGLKGISGIEEVIATVIEDGS